MKAILMSFISASAKEFMKMITCIVQFAKQLFIYLNDKRKDKKEKEAQKQQKKHLKDIEKVVDSGTLDDLLNLRK